MQFLILVLSVAITSFASASCPPPDCNASPPPDSPPYYMLADPQNCHKFYYCYDDSSGNYEITDSPFWCQDHGAVFSQENQLCGNYTCDVSCSGTCTPYECNPADAGQGKKPDPYDCSKYYSCPDDQAMQCEGDKPFFDGDQCQGDESKCCHCKPYCHKGELFKNVPDPVDCTSYYFCVKEYDFPMYQGTCDSGNFNPFTAQCEENFPCVTLCQPM
ncbi:uncharacterized protein LOC122258422 [Penaeus japonicus]|uniref:uncharacterized protein LOC122258422 n=1 Tax=Penaeus japonicus TaxID=27405 RepID=UPI001C715745|nr:uncharacterized protein LOC122258422 [Penaeus japonicus]